MGCISSSSAQSASSPVKGTAESYEASSPRDGDSESGENLDDEGEYKDMMPEPVLPTLLESAFQYARSHDDQVETASSVSSRPTTVSAIPTPSIPASALDSIVNSSIRAELDKESVRDFGRSVGAPSECAPSIGAPTIAPSICGSFDGKDRDVESMSIVASIADSRLDSQTFLQEMESSARALEMRSVDLRSVVSKTRSDESQAFSSEPRTSDIIVPPRAPDTMHMSI
mmetsp:Transcript_18292/g.30338  ORF Transcript_18292/g.30338 Transcript_18292/m.30338 type:complete len:228 (-) Transcript_18292:134-817(-)